MRTRNILIIILTAALLLSCFKKQDSNTTKPKKNEDLVALSFPRNVLQKDERLAGLEITVTNGYVRAIAYIPKDWSMGVKLEYPAKPIVSGEAGHGAGWVSDISDLDGFLLIEQWNDPKYAIKFDIEAKLFIDKKNEEEFQTKILKKSDLILKKKAT